MTSVQNSITDMTPAELRQQITWGVLQAQLIFAVLAAAVAFVVWVLVPSPFKVTFLVISPTVVRSTRETCLGTGFSLEPASCDRAHDA